VCCDLEARFPRILDEGYQITSPKATTYNCVAWAASEDTRWWWPDQYHQYYWPLRTRNLLLETFKEAFSTLGYSPCGMDASLESGFEKVAVYTSGFHVTHMARQLSSGEWTSKCGTLEDISHPALTGLECSEYGRVAVIMKRPKSRGQPVQSL